MKTCSLLFAGASLATLASSAAAQTIYKTWSGFANSKLGSAVSAFYDYNGDGYQDVLLGAPGATASHAYGVVYLVSGQALLQQNNYTILATITDNSDNSQFGATIETVGDVTGDGKPDFVVGATLHDAAATNAGRVYLYDGATLEQLAAWSGTGAQGQFGWSITHLGDWDADGLQEIAVGAPFDDNGGVDRGTLKILEINYSIFGNAWFTPVATYQGSNDLDLFGYAIDAAEFGTVGGFANRRELVIGQPLVSGFAGLNAGRVIVYAYNGSFASPALIATKFGQAGDEYGFSLDASVDVSGDGVSDLIIGAPYHDYLGIGHDNGFFHVWSGSALSSGGFTPVMATVWGEDDAHLGWSVRGIADINNDGRGEVIAGAPRGHASNPDWGLVGVWSGETSFFMSAVSGAAHELFGEYVGPAIDLDGNGMLEYIACGPQSDTGGNNAGILRTVGLYPVVPFVYCYSKVNSLGCSPAIGWTGAPSMSSSGFHIRTTGLINNTNGISFYGYNWMVTPFQGGHLCVAPPTKRLPVQNAGGSSSGSDCTGVLDYDFYSFIQGGSDPLLVAGQEVFCQTWARDPLDPFTSSFSNAMRFLIAP